MIGIVILNYNNWHDTITCIKSIVKANFKNKYRIYLVDNASPIKFPVEHINVLENSDIFYIQAEANRGYSAGNNIGILQALEDNCEAILIANNDIVFHEDSIDKLDDFLKNNPGYGIVGPKILKPDGSIQMNNLCLKTGLKEKYLVRTKLSLFNKKLTTEYFGLNRNMDTTFDVHAVPGCCFLVSKECAEKIFPMDENTFLFEEELIIGLVMEEQGFKTAYYPESVITHAHGQSTKQDSGFAQICFVKSEIYYCKKYLKARLYQLLPLYLIRTMHWCYDALLYHSFKKNFFKYFQITIPPLFLSDYFSNPAVKSQKTKTSAGGEL